VARQSLSEHSPRKVIAIFTVVGLVTTGLVAAISPFLERFFSIAGFFPVLMLALWFAPSVVNSALCGSLMGHFKFRVIAVANVVGAVARISLVLVFGLSRNFLGLAGPILATSAGITITSVWIFVAVRREASWRAGKPLQLHLGHTSWAFVSLTGFAMFAAIDVVLARHLLPATIAGNYAVASTAGKIALFLTVAVPIVAYPRFAAQQASGVSSRRELFYALAIVAVVGLLAAGTMSAVPGVVVRMLFGPRYASAAPTLRVLAPESAIMGVVGLLTYYHVARRSAFAITPWLGVAIATLSMTIAHLNAHDLAMLMLFTSIFVSVAMIVPVIAAPSSRRSLPLALSDPTGV